MRGDGHGRGWGPRLVEEGGDGAPAGKEGMARVRVGGAEVAYDVQGEGDAVVLLHPTGGSRAAWTLLLPSLTPRWRVVMPEFSGAGETVDDGGPLEVDVLVAQAAGVIDEDAAHGFRCRSEEMSAVVPFPMFIPRQTQPRFMN